jgi:transketolase
VEEVDGHDHSQLLDVLGASPKGREKPLCVIANTIKGQGVSFMRDNVAWHHGVPTKEQYEQAMRELV